MKIFGTIALAIVTLILLLAVSAIIYFDDHRLVKIISELASDKLGCDLEIVGFHLDGLSRLNCQSVEARVDNELWFEVDRIDIQINPWAIVGRKLQLKSIMIDSVYFNSAVYPPMNDTLELEARSVDENIESLGLPLALEILKLDLNNLSLADSVMGINAFGEINLSADNIRISGYDNLSPRIAITPAEFRIEYQNETRMVELNAVVDADLKIELDGIASVKTEGSISAGIRNVVYDGFSFADQYEFFADWRIELSDSQAEINRFAFRSADHELLKLSGSISDIYADTLSGAMAVQSLSIDLNDYQDEIGKF
ncbi:MAG: hypothetical protein GY839_08025, partial [candidate division Zixibacteria bacterium]|nr:hypothetical protein [candidate division Zixibacteria bacterium]